MVDSLSSRVDDLVMGFARMVVQSELSSDELRYLSGSLSDVFSVLIQQAETREELIKGGILDG